jgi:hypothetical protein
VSTWTKSAARMPRAWAVRNCFQVGPVRRGAGPIPASCSICHTVAAAIGWPVVRHDAGAAAGHDAAAPPVLGGGDRDGAAARRGGEGPPPSAMCPCVPGSGGRACHGQGCAWPRTGRREGPCPSYEAFFARRAPDRYGPAQWYRAATARSARCIRRSGGPRPRTGACPCVPGLRSGWVPAGC